MVLPVQARARHHRGMDTARPAVLTPQVAPPERIDLGDLVIRRWQRGDAEAQFQAIEASYEELHTWMPWLPERRTRAHQREFIEAAVANWPAEGNCNYGIFDPAGTLLGSLGLHDRVGPATLEIGYWCHTGYTGRGVITRSVAGWPRSRWPCPVSNASKSTVTQRISAVRRCRGGSGGDWSGPSRASGMRRGSPDGGWCGRANAPIYQWVPGTRRAARRRTVRVARPACDRSRCGLRCGAGISGATSGVASPLAAGESGRAR